jgi:F-type H+-transporting ATPase subunit epsilon
MPFELTIVTPEGEAYQGRVETVVLPGTEGDFGVLSNHEPFLTALRIGPAEVKTNGDTYYAALSGGWAEVHGDSVTVVTSTCEFAHDIDRERAEVARERAHRMLDEMRATVDGEELYHEYQAAYSRAITRLNVSKKQEQFKH